MSAPDPRTWTLPGEGALLLAGVGMAPALAALAWPAATWAWFAVLAACALAAAAARGRLPSSDRLETVRELPGRMTIGASEEVALEVGNGSGVDLRLQIRDAPPAGLGDGELGSPVLLPAGARHRWTYRVRPCDRGSYRWDEVWLRWWSPGRIWIRQARIPLESTAEVYPDVRPLTDVSPLMIRKLVSDLGIKQQRRRGSGTEFDHIKEHTPDDGTGGIDWKATARRARPMVRQYRVEQNHDVIIGVDTGRLMGTRVEGVTKLDHAINAALLLARVCLVHGDRPGLMTYDSRVHGYLRPGGDRGQMERLLHALHDLRSDFSETIYRRALVHLDTRQRKRALVVLLTDFVHGQADEQLVRGLLGLARRHLVLFVALRDPHLDRLAAAMPRTPDDVYAKVVAQGIEDDRRVVMRTLSGRGIHTLDLAPAQVTQQVISRYLALRQGI